MSFQVTIRPSGHSFTVHADEPVLEAALREGWTLSYGCRNGACGACKGKVLSGQVDHGDAQEATLTGAERAQGLTLFCQARALSDLEIEVREVGAVKGLRIHTLPARVQRIERVNHDVAVLELKLPANEKFAFLAGQYVDILLKDGKRRSFSMANAPHREGMIELHVRDYPGGHFSHHVYHEMKEKTILRLEGPLGTFFLREDSDKPVVFLAGGTGFAPVKAILEHAFHAGITRPLHLYWGARSLADIYMPALVAEWAAQHAHFHYVPVLSEAREEDAWTGRIGFVHEAVLEDFESLAGVQVYACGPPPMIEAGHRAFLAHGLPEDEFYSDAFTPSKDGQAAKA